MPSNSSHGRYAYSPIGVAPSRIKSPISPFKPFALPGFGGVDYKQFRALC